MKTFWQAAGEKSLGMSQSGLIYLIYSVSEYFGSDLGRFILTRLHLQSNQNIVTWHFFGRYVISHSC